MVAYAVQTEDLIGVADQLGLQAGLVGSTRGGVTMAATSLLEQLGLGLSQAEATIEDLLHDLTSTLRTADDAVAAADWLGSDSDAFRHANTELTAAVGRSRDQLQTAVMGHRAATSQLGATLVGALEQFTTEASRSQELTSQLSAAVGAEAQAYEQAFAGSWNGAGVAAFVGVAAGAVSTTTLLGDVLQNSADDLQKKAPLHAADFLVNGVVPGLVAKHVTVLRSESDRLLADAARATERYLQSPGGSAEARYQSLRAYEKFVEADSVSRQATSVARRFGRTIPIVGAGITAAGIGYDISKGKPAGLAVVSGLGGALASAGTAAAIGFAVGGPVGLVAGAAGGLIVGVGVEGLIDAGYERLPEGVKASIEDGTRAVGAAISEAGDALGDRAQHVWQSIF